MALDLIAMCVLFLNWPVFLRRFEKLFIGGNEETALVAVDIPRRLFAGLDYFGSTQGGCAGLVSNQSNRGGQRSYLDRRFGVNLESAFDLQPSAEVQIMGRCLR